MKPTLVIDDKRYEIGSISWVDGKIVNVSYYHDKENDDYRTIFNTDDDLLPVDLNKLIEWEKTK